MVGPAFVCTECEQSVSVLSYRASCPDCGGRLDRQLGTP
jgi:hypothetical protein